MKSLFLFAGITAVCFLAGTHRIEAQKKSAATPSPESVADAYFQYRVTSQSGGALSPSGFRKTNGYESGFGMYVLEWQADVVATRDCFKFAYTGDWLWQNFAVTDRGVGGLDALVMQTSPLSQGTRVRLTGTATFRKTEKGPRLEAFDVKTSQVLGRVAATPPRPISKPKIPAPALSNTKVTAQLESSWNFYIKQSVFLGPTYCGNSSGGGQIGYAFRLMSECRTYRVLTTKGLIKLDELSLSDIPDGVIPNGTKIESAVAVSLTEAGAKLGKFDEKENTVTFVFGTYRVERITSNSVINTDAGNYRLVMGTRLLDIAPAFADTWTNLNWPTYREGRFRAIFVYEGDEWTRSDGTSGRDAPRWKVANASNGRFAAQDVGPRNGDFESNNVPPTFAQLGGGRMPVAASPAINPSKPKTAQIAADSGISWVKTNFPSDVDLSTARLAVNLIGHVFVGTDKNGIYRSMDNGASWIQTNKGLNADSAGAVYIVALAINSRGDLFAATLSDIYRSVDNGNRWTKQFSNADGISVLAINSRGYIFAGAGEGIYRSTDNGLTWAAKSNGLINDGFDRNTVSAIAFNPSGDVFAGTFDGVYRSTDNGENWTRKFGDSSNNAFVLGISPNGSIFTQLNSNQSRSTGDEGIYRSTDNGNNWTRLKKEADVVAFNSSGHVFLGDVGISSGVYRSINNGDSWTNVSKGLVLGKPNTDKRVSALAISPSGIMFAVTPSGIYRSK